MRRAASAHKESFRTLLHKYGQPANSMTLWHIGVPVERFIKWSLDRAALGQVLMMLEERI